MPRLFKIGFWFTAIGFAGLGLSRLIADRYFGGEHEMMQTRYGRLVVMTSSLLWLIGTLVVLPVAVLVQRRRMPESEMTIYPWWQWVLLVPYFDRDNDAKVPRWIWMPIFAIGLLLALALLLIFGALGLHRLLNPTGS